MKRNIILNQTTLHESDTKNLTVGSLGSMDMKDVVTRDEKKNGGEKGKGVFRVEAPGRRLENNISMKARRERQVHHHLTISSNIMTQE